MALPNLSQISEALDNIMPELTPVPVGTVAYAHEVPTGWLQCNGAEVSRTTYARLFRKIGTKYGAGNGSTTFNLPDLQHRVLEGTNTTSEVAQKVEAGLPDITGVTFGAQIRDGEQQEECYGAFSYVETHDGKIAGGTSFWASSIRFDARKANAIYKDIPLPQVPALRLLAIIKS